MFFIRSSLCIILLLAIGVPALAQQQTETTEQFDTRFQESRQKQADEFKKWKTETQGVFTVYTPPSGGSRLISFIGDAGTDSARNVEGIARLALAAESACPGFSKTKPDPSLTSATGATQHLETEKNYCSLTIARSVRLSQSIGQPTITTAGSPMVVVLLLAANSDKEPNDQALSMVYMASYIQSRLTPLIKPDGTAQVPTWESDGNSKIAARTNGTIATLKKNDPLPEAIPNTSSSDLKAVMDAIPRANRPIGLVYTEGAWDSFNMSVTFNAHLLFPNGIAINPKCPAWNPMKPITQTTAMGCGFGTYTLEGDRAYIDGKSESINDYQGFKKGERVSINFSNIGGLANNGLNPAGANATWGGDLTMTPSGQIRVGSWSGATVDGPNFVAYGGSESRGIQGEYYLDGYLIGVKDAQGRISVSLIWQQDGQHVFLNGKQYNR